MQTTLLETQEAMMAQVNSASINNYVAQQESQRKLAQLSSTIEVDKSKTTVVSDNSSRGVIVQISKEARRLAKESLAESDIILTLEKRAIQNNLKAALSHSKRLQNEAIQNNAENKTVINKEESKTAKAEQIAFAA